MATALLEPAPAATTSTPRFVTWPEDGSRPAGYFSRDEAAAAAAFYRENGFVVIEEGVSRREVAELAQETARLCRNPGGSIGGIAEAPAGTSDEEAIRKVLCIHFPHKISEVFQRALSHTGITDVLTAAIGPNVKCMQSMLFVKASGKPGQAWHQDEDFIPTRDRSLAGAWIALDDATIENGCLWVIPKSQKPGVLWPMKKHLDMRFDCTHESFNFPYTEADEVPVEVKAGSIVFFNGYLLHRSLPNRSEGKFRRALVNHYMSAESLLPWHHAEGVGMGLQDFRDIVMVAGRDPYAQKGTIDAMKPHVRGDGKGGCADWSEDERKLMQGSLEGEASAGMSGGGMAVAAQETSGGMSGGACKMG